MNKRYPLAMVLMGTLMALPAPARGPICGDVDQDGIANVVDALKIARGEPLMCPVCGNGLIEPAEECDQGDLGGATCETYGLPFGQLSCALGCLHDFSGCRAQRFEDNGDGTITDWQSGLMWEKKTVSGLGDWYRWSASQGDPDGELFISFLGALNDCTDDGTDPATGVTGGFAGYCDWRLPTIVELQSILLEPPPCDANPCIDPIFGVRTVEGYWSSTTDSGDSFGAWTIRFRDGATWSQYKDSALFALAVRGGP